MNIPKDLKERNKWFEGLSREDKIAVVAQDVITQVTLNKFVPKHNKYFTVSSKLKESANLQEVIEEQESCQVCAIGAVFASKVRLGNNVMLNEISSYENSISETSCYNVEDKIYDIFEEEQLRLMEVAFEGYDAVNYFEEQYGWELDEDGDCDYIDSQDYLDAVSFNGGYSDSSELLIAIMQNVIDNNGVFIP